MAGEAGSVERIAIQIGRALGTLAQRFEKPDIVFEDFGLRPPEGFVDQFGTEIGAAIDAAADLPALVTTLTDAIEASDPDVGAIAAAGKALVDGITLTVQRIRELRSALSTVGGSFPGLTPDEQAQVAAFAQEFLERLLGSLVADVLRETFPRVFGAAELIGLVEHVRDVPGDNDVVTEQTERLKVRFDLLPLLFSDPAQYLEQAYGWGTTNFKAELLFFNFQRFLDEQVGVPSQLITVSGLPPVLEAFLFNVTLDDQPDPPGLRLDLRITPDQDIVFSGPLTENWDLAFTVKAQFDQDVSVGLRPPFALAFQPFAGTTASLDLSLGIARSATAGPLLLIGQTGGSRLEVGHPDLKVGAKGQWDGNGGPSVEPSVSADLSEGRVIIKAGEGDGFLKEVLGGQDLEGHFDLGLDWSPSGGLKIHGAGQLEITLPVSVSIGPVRLSAIHLGLGLGANGFTTAISATADATLGPVAVAVDRIGVAGDLTFPSEGGNLGPLDLDVSFKPPTGLGIAVNAGPVHGGGFISFEPDLGRYSGALELSIYDISVKAFGLIETKEPGVSFSFVIVISAEFTPIQLGFGFTLIGVGGLVGINRTVNSNELGKLVREGRSEELLFPKNLIANAPTIIRDLGTVFPARPSHYVFGPLGKLGWGTPTLITGEIGIIIEIPGVVVLLGEVKILLPKPEVPLVKMNMSVGGTLDFPNKTFSLDAALHDSIIEGYPISGQMALRVKWGEQPNFVASIGGFHPAYQPPKDFPKLQPMTLDLGQHGSASITVSGFFAVTSNTVQVGGDARLHAGGSGISMDASVSVKALFVFAPFHFEATIDASVKISFHGYGPSVHLHGVLEGPSPWHIRGELCVSIIWWDACLRFDETFGGTETAAIPAIDPWDGTDEVIGLHAALADAGNWSGVLPAGTASVVSRAQGSEKLVDPVGGMSVHQKAVPVETQHEVNRFGVAKVKTPTIYKLLKATLGPPQPPPAAPPPTLTTLSPVKDFFAPAQYFQMDDGKKLSAAGYEQEQAGYVFGENSANLRAGSQAPVTSNYTTYIIAGDGTISEPRNDTATQAQMTGQNKRSAVAVGGVTQLGTRRFIDRLITQAFDILPHTFILSNNNTLTPILAGQTPATRTSALLSMDAYRLQNQEQRLLVQVSALHELAA